jgi:hypothetical protein
VRNLGRNKIVAFVLLAAVLVSALAILWYDAGRQPVGHIPSDAFVKNEIIVKFKVSSIPQRWVLISGYLETGLPSIDVLNSKYQIDSYEGIVNCSESEKLVGFDRIFVLKSTRGFDVLSTCKEYGADPNVEYAEPDWIIRGLIE